MITKNYILVVSLIFLTLTTQSKEQEISVIQGTIRFSLGFSSNGVRIYEGGTKIPTTIEDNLITYAIKAKNNQNSFYILIANAQSFEYPKKQPLDDSSIDQTIQYRSIVQGKPYKLYRVTLIQKENSVEQVLLALDNQQTPNEYDWYIESLQLKSYDIIPDETIVILYNPEYVQGLQSEGAYKLPTIVIKKEIENIEKLHEHELINLLASLDTDTIHAPTKRKIADNKSCKRIIDYIG